MCLPGRHRRDNRRSPTSARPVVRENGENEEALRVHSEELGGRLRGQRMYERVNHRIVGVRGSQMLNRWRVTWRKKFV